MSNNITKITSKARGQGSISQFVELIVPWTQESGGVIPVPDGTSDGTEYSIPFGSVEAEATFFFVKNSTGASLAIRMNGVATGWSVPNGASLLYQAPSSVTLGEGMDTALTQASVVTNVLQDGDGSVEFLVLSAPEG